MFPFSGLFYRNDWASQFHPRNLVTYSVNPLFVFPTHYTGENNYISDTETSGIWEEVKENEGDDKSNGTSTQSAEQELSNVNSVSGKDDSVKESLEHTEL